MTAAALVAAARVRVHVRVHDALGCAWPATPGVAVPFEVLPRAACTGTCTARALPGAGEE